MIEKVTHRFVVIILALGAFLGLTRKRGRAANINDALERIAQKPLYLICKTGGRSALAAESLERMGFNNVYSVDGGMTAWQEEKRPVVAGE